MSGAVPRAGEGTRPAMDSYRPKGYQMSAALLRARAPFRTRNALVGAAVAVFAISVYAYSIRAVKQEDFSDIDILAPPLTERTAIKSIEDEQREKQKLKALSTKAPAGTTPSLKAAVTARDSPVENDNRSAILQPAASSTPDSVAPALLETPISTPTPATRGVLSKILPAALRPKQGTLVWGAPDVDRIGTIYDRQPQPDGKRSI